MEDKMVGWSKPLTVTYITNIDNGTWTAVYNYARNGDMNYRTIQSSTTSFSYAGNKMAGASGGESFSLDYDLNGVSHLDDGNMKTLPTTDTNSLVYNWDGKLRSAQKGSSTISLRYDPWGNRIKKTSSVNGERKYIVDVVGDLPTILMEINTGDSAVKKIYIYANSRIVMQHDVVDNNKKYFYLHDRLGSVREIIDSSAAVKAHYNYNPFGKTLEISGLFGTTGNRFRFAGRWYDNEIDEYYLRARQYHPHIGRFTARDPVEGCFKEPMSWHKYLYC